MKRLRVLISSHEFSPYQGSECAVGWNICTGLAKYHDVTVLCADGPAPTPNTYQAAYLDYLSKHGNIPNLNVVFVKQPPATLRYAEINRKLMTMTRGMGWQILYYFGLDHWHRAAYNTASLLGFENFDLVHQLTPISFLRPGYLWTSGLPFYWGPLGGMFKVPGAFARLGGPSAYVFESLRNANIERQIRARTFIDIVCKAKRIWTVTDDDRRVIEGVDAGKAVPMVDTAPPREITGRLREYNGEEPLKLCWSGGHEPWKALPILLRAIATLPRPNKVSLDVLGQGSEGPKWKALADSLGLNSIKWHGRLPHSEALMLMDRSHVFIHTSYREAASMVILEALGWGLPVICHDACGMAVAVNDTCGIKVPFVNPEHSIRGFRDALASLLQCPDALVRLSAGALRRAAELSWEAKVKEIAEAYHNHAKSE